MAPPPALPPLPLTVQHAICFAVCATVSLVGFFFLLSIVEDALLIVLNVGFASASMQATAALSLGPLVKRMTPSLKDATVTVSSEGCTGRSAHSPRCSLQASRRCLHPEAEQENCCW